MANIVIQAPINAGSFFYNYKGTHSVVLLAVCDAHYRFILVDVGKALLLFYNTLYVLYIHVSGDAGRHSDGGVLANSEFGQALEDGVLGIPDDQPLLGTYYVYSTMVSSS